MSVAWLVGVGWKGSHATRRVALLLRARHSAAAVPVGLLGSPYSQYGTRPGRTPSPHANSFVIGTAVINTHTPMPGNNSGRTRAMSLGIGRLGSDGFWIKDYKGGVPSSRPPFWRTPDQSEHSGLHVRFSDSVSGSGDSEARTLKINSTPK